MTFGLTVEEGCQFSFAGPQSYSLDSIELAAGLYRGDNQLNVALRTDASGVPGTILESFSFTGMMGPWGSINPLLVGTSALHPLLSPGTNYWLTVSAPATTSAAWNWSAPEVLGTVAMSQDGNLWIVDQFTMAAFRINGTATGAPIPAPGAILLGAIGAGLVGGLRRQRGI